MRFRARAIPRYALLTFIPALVLGAAAFRHDSEASTPRGRGPAEFSIVLSKTPTGIVASCGEGCAWKELHAGCGEDDTTCAFRITSEGVERVKRSGE